MIIVTMEKSEALTILRRNVLTYVHGRIPTLLPCQPKLA